MRSDRWKAQLSAPVTVTWEVTRECNLQCVHCLSRSGHGEGPSLTSASEIICQLASSGVFQVNIGGGEPLVHPDIFAILERCVDRELVTCISTNGTLLTPHQARRLGDLDIRVQVSLDGATSQTNDTIRGAGSFCRSLRALELLRSHVRCLTINVVLTRLNYAELDSLYGLASGFGAKLRVSRLRPSGRGTASWQALRLERHQLLAFRHWLDRHPTVLTGDSFFFLGPRERAVNALGMCGAGTLTCSIDPDGNVYPCAFTQWDSFRCGNLNEQGFLTIWREAPVLAALRDGRLMACSECGRSSDCEGGCPAVAYGVTGRFGAPDPECVFKEVDDGSVQCSR